MYCKKCGTEITEGVVCPNCGQDNSAPEEYEPVKLEGDVPAQKMPDGMLANSAPGKKKKKKTGLIVGLSVAGAVAVGAAVGYFGFHDSITRLIMGDAGYAKYLGKQALGAIVKNIGTDDLADKASQLISAAGNAAADLRPLFSPAVSGSEPSGAASPDIASLLTSALKNVPEGKELTTAVSLNVQPGSMIVNETVRSVADIINSISLNTSAAKNGEAAMVSAGASENGSRLGALELYSDGSNAVLALPGISGHTVQFPSGGKADGAKDTALDADEVKRIIGRISDIWFESFDSADITFTGKDTDTLTGGDIAVSAEGRSVTVTISEEQVNAMLTKMAEELKNDSCLIKYVNECFGMSEEDYRKLFPEEIKAGCALSVRHIYDVHNNVLSSHISANASGVLTDLGIIGAGDNIGAGFRTESSGSSVSVRIAARSTGKADGNANISIDINGTEFGLAAEYSGVKTVKWLGKDTLVGKVTVKPADADAFGSALYNGVLSPAGLAGDGEKIAAELKQFVFSAECGTDGGTCTGEVSVSLGNFGTAGIKTVSEEKDAAVTMPEATDTFDNISGALSEDLGAWVRKLMEDHPAVSGALTGQTDNGGAQSDSSHEQVIPNAEGTYGLAGTWNITAVDDRAVSGTGIAMQAVLDDKKLILTMTDGTDENSYLGEFELTYGLLKNGEYGAYFYGENSAPIGYIYTQNGVFAVLVDESESKTTYMMKDGIGLNINIDTSKMDSDVDIGDITGRWQGSDFSGGLYMAAITPDMLMTDMFEVYGLVQLAAEDGGFGVYVYGKPHTGENRIGELKYSRSEDALYLTRTSDGADAALARIDDIVPEYPYAGEWTLAEVNGQTVEELAKASNMTFEEATGNIYVSSFVMLTQSKSGFDVRLMQTPNESGFTIDMAPYEGRCTYDPEEDSFTVTLIYEAPEGTPTDGTSSIQPEGGSSIAATMKYKRGTYNFE